MKRVCRAGIAALTLLGWTGAAMAQQDIVWKQVVNTPKGLNMPTGVKADILGIEVGESYAEAKPKLERLLAEAVKPPPRTEAQKRSAEMMGESSAPPVQEKKAVFRFSTPGSSSFTAASFVNEIVLRRELPGTTKQNITENITVVFSAPSSGSQVLGIARTIDYPAEGDQPRLSELMGQLKEKFRASPQTYELGPSIKYVFQFDNGRVAVPPKPYSEYCALYYAASQSNVIPGINRTGDCDVVLFVEVRYGISKDHVKTVKFTLSDNERTKANVGADFAFFDSYVKNLQTQTKGAAPKL